MDRLLGYYRPMIRGKKWWWPLVMNLVNVSIVAAWKLYSAIHPEERKKKDKSTVQTRNCIGPYEILRV